MITSRHEGKTAFLFHTMVMGGELNLSAVISLDHTAHLLKEIGAVSPSL
jgi:hypothetical protein